MARYFTSTSTLGGVGWGNPYEKVGDAHREFLFWPLRGTEKGVVQALFRALRANKNGSVRTVLAWVPDLSHHAPPLETLVKRLSRAFPMAARGERGLEPA